MFSESFSVFFPLFPSSLTVLTGSPSISAVKEDGEIKRSQASYLSVSC
ncbi:hypothetical protein CHCC16736_2957 [Bacillus licheniformis]|uniref:Uncharacterized protein n=1 Tax=Bacillus licheniformis TaxID=1402 RepID=A0A8B5YCK1_BACLI|nr:hypothetical protein B4164_4105 [Bacillus licheniformis]TWL27636.1 hypothetical protein CHCC16736_2957 [Bacillus licheniformis]TWL27841.1 hypothetical protein CHCC15546_2182 [Bacillus licheniformis]TWL75403.1 hypothetical protein CHCC15315_3906 [Bacillus licheniformis]